MKTINLSLLAVRHGPIVLFLIIVSMLAGAFAYLQLGRAEDPSFTIKTMIVQARWPGATAEDMQNFVAEPIERRLQEFAALDYVRTYARPGSVVLQIVLKDATRGRDVTDIWYQVRKKIGDSRGELPADVEGPYFDDEYGEVFAAIYMLTGEGVAPAELKHYALMVQKSLLRVQDVAKVEVAGDLDPRIHVEISHRKLATLGLPVDAVFDAIRDQNAMQPAGAVETGADRVQIHVTGAFEGVDAIADAPIEVGGQSFRLGDIARVSPGYEDPPQFLIRHDGQPAVGVGVVMADNANVQQLGADLKHAIAEIEREIPLGVSIDQIADQPKVVEESVGEFIKAFAEALAIVLLVSFAALGWRSGIVIALAVPLVIAMIMVVMQAAGMNLDRITLGALIIALGLLVDDAIIAVEMMVVKIEQGLDRIQAAAFAWNSTAFPMLTGTLVSAAGFLPVGFAQSTAGEYAGNIFWVVALALVISWIVAVVFTPYLGAKLLPAGRARPRGADHTAPEAIYQARPYRALRRSLHWALAHRWLVIAMTVLGFVLSGAGMGLVQQQFFPASSRPELFIELRMPEGTSIRATEEAARKAERLLKSDPDVRSYTTYVGQGSLRFFLALNPALPNPNFALVVIMTSGPKGLDRLKDKIEQAVQAGAIAEARVRVDRLSFGPPVGFPVQFRVVGPDPVKVRAIAAKVRDVMRANPHTVEVQFDWNEQAKQVMLVVDQDRARAFGLSQAEIAHSLETLLSGRTMTQYREGTELIDVVARAVPEERLQLDRLRDLTIMTPSGRAVPVSQLANLRYGFEEPILWRRDRDLVLTVRSDVQPGIQAPTVTAEIEPALQPLIQALPPGYRIDTGGAIEESAKANAALFKVFPAMFLVMLTLLMFQLQSFSKLFLVVSTAPLGLIGAVAALLAFDAPFGFVALLGVIALAGMIMRNAVILVDQIDQDLSAGLPAWTAIVESTVRRARPVILTALAAILAMIPLSRSVFWGPMAISMMGGLLIGTVLTLLFLPALYAAWFRVRRPNERHAKPQAIMQVQPAPACDPAA